MKLPIRAAENEWVIFRGEQRWDQSGGKIKQREEESGCEAGARNGAQNEKKEVKTRQHENTEHERDVKLDGEINQEVRGKKQHSYKVDKLDKELAKKQQDRADTHTHTKKYTD